MDDLIIRQHLKEVGHRIETLGGGSRPPDFPEQAALYLAVERLWDRHLEESEREYEGG